MIKVTPFIYDDYDEVYANTYVLFDDKNNAVVIDPGKDYPGIVNYIKKNNLNLKAILITHGHFDHIRGVNTLLNKFKVPVYIGFDDEDKLTNVFTNGSAYFGNEVIIDIKANTVADNEVLKLLNEDIKVITTPYHTSGSVCFYLKDSNLLFTGDFIIPHSVGRSDLPSAKPKELNNSMAKILVLPNETKIYGGHGPSSTLEIERRVNPFVK